MWSVVLRAGALVGAGLVAGCGAPAPTVPTERAPAAVVVPPPPPARSVTGVVKDAWLDLPLENVVVSGSGGPVPVTTTTDGSGRYALVVPAGSYVFRFARPPYSTWTAVASVQEDMTITPTMNPAVDFPARATNLQGHWYGGGAFPGEPFFLTLLQDGTSLSGGYKDRENASYRVTGTWSAPALFVRSESGPVVITLDATIDDAHHAHGDLRISDRGKYPFSMVR